MFSAPRVWKKTSGESYVTPRMRTLGRSGKCLPDPRYQPMPYPLRILDITRKFLPQHPLLPDNPQREGKRKNHPD